MSLGSLPAVSARDVPSATAEQMAEADRVFADDHGSTDVLMQRAAYLIALTVRKLFDDREDMRIAAIAGRGNNGGDALAALQYLHGWGAPCVGYVGFARDALRPQARWEHDALVRAMIRVTTTTGIGDGDLITRLTANDLLLDGLVGYSATGAPRGEVARLIKVANAASGGGIRPILAVDLPSGLDPDEGIPLSDVPGETIRASVTVTLGLPKTGLIAESARAYVGELVLADIGIPPAVFERVGIDTTRVFERGPLLRVVS